MSIESEMFPAWKIKFAARELFNRAVPLCDDCDVGHADMVLTFEDQQDFNANLVRLRSAGITQFTTEKP